MNYVNRNKMAAQVILIMMVLMLLGCSDDPTSRKTGPTADFSATPTGGVEPLAVSFSDASTPGTSAITSWTWDFGDNATSSSQNPSHTYVTGTYSVSLTVTTSVGSDTKVRSGLVTVSPQPLSNSDVALQSKGGTATAISEGTYLGQTQYDHYANDGTESTSWSDSWDMPAWLRIEFDQIYAIDSVGVLWASHQHTFSISLSTDGNSWTTVVPSRLSNNSEGSQPVHESFTISSTNAKYIKIDITTTSAPYSHIFQASVGELEAYGH